MFWLQNAAVDECGVSGGLSDTCAVVIQAQLQMVVLSSNITLAALQVRFRMMSGAVLCCAVLHNAVWCCILLSCLVLFSVVLFAVLCCVHSVVLSCAILYCLAVCYAVSCCTVTPDQTNISVKASGLATAALLVM